ncbi:MAG: class I tRNA ligase family protein [Candidatus Taylorbacteria bacterium]
MNNEEKKGKNPVAEKEEEILQFWQENGIFEKSLKKNEGKKEFVFYDGPPFATGLPHYGHILPGTIKDVIPRFKTMQGHFVRRKWGWDCHGLPIENIVEKELGLKSKKDILDFGIGAFNKVARSKISLYADDWKRIMPRTGRWVDMEHDYKTMDTSYTESVWWAFKTLYEKKLIYEGYKVMPYCPRCETVLSNFEVNQGYKDITDISVYAKFKLKDEENTFLLAWTTTPWTLPGNIALAVNPSVEYVKIQIAEENFFLAKVRLSAVKEAFTILSECRGIDLIGKSYVPIFDYYSKDKNLKNRENGFKVYGADFVTTEEGTGIVHIAPAFGSDDYELSQKEKLPFIQHVNLHGEFKPEVSDFAGQLVKPKDDHQKGDVEIIKNLAHRGLLFAKEKITHSYPHCWRCETPLLNYATSSWFLKVTALKGKLVSENKKVEWTPEHVKEGRFGKWLEGAKDWAISRSRFWGAPLPVWKCSLCKRICVLGSIDSMRALSLPRNSYFVMRHGEAESNVLDIISSDPNQYGLTERGKGEVKESAKKLKTMGIDLIVTSPFKRTLSTARILREALGLPREVLIVDSLLHEINAGVLNGKSRKEYRSYLSHHGRFNQAPPDGESLLDVKKRMGDCLAGLEKKYEGKKILVITHDTPAWLLFSAAQGMNSQESFSLHDNKDYFLKNTEVRALKWNPLPRNDEYVLDLHRPYIDAFTFPCSCGGKMERVPEIFDTWFDSGSMPFAQFHYPFQNRDLFEPRGGLFQKMKGFPADFIAEGLDQTRGWFYTLIVLSVALFKRSPYKRVVVNGLILAEDGRKMAKSLKNYPDLMDVIRKYGADALRLYLMGSPVTHGEEMNFKEMGVDEVYKKNILRLRNVVSFYEMYAGESTKFEIRNSKMKVESSVKGQLSNVLDEWIKARMGEVILEVTDSLEKYELDKAVTPIVDFIDDLSTWYLRRGRDRYKGENVEDKETALATTRFILIELAKVMAPFAPFIAEDIYQRVRREKAKPNQQDSVARSAKGGFRESVHLENWPQTLHVTRYTLQALEDMREVRRIVSLGLEARMKAGIKVRQPLQKLKVKPARTYFGTGGSAKWKVAIGLLDLIKDELNVKEVIIDNSISNEIELDTVLTPSLKKEGDLREAIRAIQELRKEKGLKPGELVVLATSSTISATGLLQEFELEIKKSASLSKIEHGTSETGEFELK